MLVDDFCYGFYLLGFFLQWFIVFCHYCVVVDVFGMFFEVWASIYYMLYAFYFCRAPSALGIFAHTFVIVFCFYHSASNCKYAGTFVPSEGVHICWCFFHVLWGFMYDEVV